MFGNNAQEAEKTLGRGSPGPAAEQTDIPMSLEPDPETKGGKRKTPTGKGEVP